MERRQTFPLASLGGDHGILGCDHGIVLAWQAVKAPVQRLTVLLSLAAKLSEDRDRFPSAWMIRLAYV
jgi:hypothetical protein